MPYQSIATKNVTLNNGPQRIAIVNSVALLIKLTTTNSFVSGYSVEYAQNSGTRFRIRWVQNGSNGQLIPLEFGEHEILFDVPSPLESYELEILPARLIFNYEVEVLKQIYNPRFDSLSQSLGIPIALLQNIPQQTLLILEGVNLMASTDIRSTLNALEMVITQSVASTAGLASQVAAFSALSNATVVQKSFNLLKAAFLLEGAVYRAPIAHNMATRSPVCAVYDADGDLQLVQVIGLDASNLKIELTASQYNDNTYPLTVNLQAQNIVPSGRTGADIGGGNLVSLLSGTLSRLVSGNWVTIDSNVTAAKYRNGRVVYLIAGNTALPKISAIAGGFTPVGGSTNDWTDEAGSPSVPA